MHKHISQLLEIPECKACLCFAIQGISDPMATPCGQNTTRVYVVDFSCHFCHVSMHPDVSEIWHYKLQLRLDLQSVSGCLPWGFQSIVHVQSAARSFHSILLNDLVLFSPKEHFIMTYSYMISSMCVMLLLCLCVTHALYNDYFCDRLCTFVCMQVTFLVHICIHILCILLVTYLSLAIHILFPYTFTCEFMHKHIHFFMYCFQLALATLLAQQILTALCRVRSDSQ